MKNEYIVKNDEVIVTDDKELKIVEYQDNIEEIFKQENLIEEIEKELKSAEKGMKDYNPKKPLKRVIIIVLIPIVASFIISMICQFPEDFFIPFFCFSAVICVMVSCSVYFEEKNHQKYCKGNKVIYEYLIKRLDKEKSKLQSLKDEKSKERISEKIDEPIKIDNVLFNEMNHKIELCYELGRKVSKYQRLYQKGNLNDELKKEYSIEDSEFIEKIVKEEAQKLEYSYKND